MDERHVPEFAFLWLEHHPQDALGLAERDLRRCSPVRRRAAEALVREMVDRCHLLHRRRRLEAVQRALLRRAGEAGEAESHTPRPKTRPLPPDTKLTPDAFLVAAALLTVRDMDDAHAALELGSRRAAVHFENAELADGNRVMGFHNAALRSRAAARRPAPAPKAGEANG